MPGSAAGHEDAADDLAAARAERVAHLHQIVRHAADLVGDHQHELEERADEDQHDLRRLADAEEHHDDRDQRRHRDVADELGERLHQALADLERAHGDADGNRQERREQKPGGDAQEADARVGPQVAW